MHNLFHFWLLQVGKVVNGFEETYQCHSWLHFVFGQSEERFWWWICSQRGSRHWWPSRLVISALPPIFTTRHDIYIPSSIPFSQVPVFTRFSSICILAWICIQPDHNDKLTLLPLLDPEIRSIVMLAWPLIMEPAVPRVDSTQPILIPDNWRTSFFFVRKN